MREFFEGQKVKPKNGGPEMVILKVLVDDAREKRYQCTWFDFEGMLQFQYYIANQLALISH